MDLPTKQCDQPAQNPLLMMVRVNGRAETRQIARMHTLADNRIVAIPVLNDGEHYERDPAGNVHIYGQHGLLSKLVHLRL